MIREFGSEDLTGDALRVHNAVEHCRGLLAGTLSVHAVAMARDERGVLLFGGHGAGKSVTGMAMAARGWLGVAGDVALVQVPSDSIQPRLVGGTRRFLLRPTALAVRDLCTRPLLVEAKPGPKDRVDVTGSLAWVSLGADSVDVRLAVYVAVDFGVDDIARLTPAGEHTSQSVWWRASSHLLDRILDDPCAEPLRSLERPELSTIRMGLVRAAARMIPVFEAYGTPDGIAEAIERGFAEALA